LTHSQSHIIYSNVKSIIEQQQYLFNNLWEKSIKFKLNDVISFVINDVQKQRHRLTIGTEFRRGAKITYSNLLEKEEQSNDDANSNDVFLEADKERITQVLINLLDNALKSTKENDIISIIVQIQEDGRRNPEVIINIKDSGMGIDPMI
jgi:signal transduction histidine kinase